MTSPEILPCPFCGGGCVTDDDGDGNGWRVECDWTGCDYCAPSKASRSEAITAHNRVAGAAGLLAEARDLFGECRRALRSEISVGIHCGRSERDMPEAALEAKVTALLTRIDALGGGK